MFKLTTFEYFKYMSIFVKIFSLVTCRYCIIWSCPVPIIHKYNKISIFKTQCLWMRDSEFTKSAFMLQLKIVPAHIWQAQKDSKTIEFRKRGATKRRYRVFSLYNVYWNTYSVYITPDQPRVWRPVNDLYQEWYYSIVAWVDRWLVRKLKAHFVNKKSKHFITIAFDIDLQQML